MHGNNPISQARSRRSYLVKEIFYTIQGEGPFAGEPAVFVRFAGCNLRCHFCDTDFDGGKCYSLAELIAAIEAIRSTRPTNLIVLTGGEPMLQDLGSLADTAALSKICLQIETAGTVSPFPETDLSRFHIVCSPKTRGISPLLVPHVKAWKYIIRNGETDPFDGLPNVSTQNPDTKIRLFRPFESPTAIMAAAPIYVQPCDENDANANNCNLHAATQIALKFGYRLSLQLHKIARLP